MTQQLTSHVTPDGKMYWTDEQGQAFDTPEEANQDPEEDQERGLTIINPAHPVQQLPSLTNLPPHFQVLELHKHTPEEQAELVLMATEYLGAPRDLVEFMNLDIEVAGAALIWHPPYAAKGSQPGDPLMPDYYNCRFRLTDGTIIESSSGIVAQTLAGLLPALGWYDWKVPVTFHVEMKKGAHYISRVKKGEKK